MNTSAFEKVVKEYGTPLYVFDEDKFKSYFKELDSAFKAVYSEFQIAYSFKTNYMPYVCRRVLSLGGWAEVVSDMEYRMAKMYGFKPQNIIVNGPGKWNGLRDMVVDDAVIMLDNEFELEKVISIAEETEHTAQVGFRLNIDIGTNKNSRFGFDVLNPTTEEAIKVARNNENIKIVGLHFHLSGARGLQSWKARAEKMIYYSEYLLKDSESKIIDIGSGMFGHLDPVLAEQFNQLIPSFKEYASEVASAFSSHFQSEKRPLLVVEPGTTLVADTMSYLTRVIATKNIRDRNIAIVDGSVQQLGELGKKKKLPLDIIHGSSSQTFSNVDITGYTCLEDDILYSGLDRLISVDDVLSFGNAGAYTNVLKPPFIQPGCKIVAVNNKGETVLIKREETVSDILASYILV